MMEISQKSDNLHPNIDNHNLIDFLKNCKITLLLAKMHLNHSLIVFNNLELDVLLKHMTILLEKNVKGKTLQIHS